MNAAEEALRRIEEALEEIRTSSARDSFTAGRYDGLKIAAEILAAEIARSRA